MGIPSDLRESSTLCVYLNPKKSTLCLKDGLHKCRLKQERGFEITSCDFSAGYVNTWKTEYDPINARNCPMFILDSGIAERAREAVKDLYK
ncbi:MAG: hypothetical protein AABX50_02665 [Nanoarchaeota archaeon]